MMIELKSCPFCGGKAIMETFTIKREGIPRYRVKCSECEIDVGWDWFSEDEAANKWNKRANDET